MKVEFVPTPGRMVQITLSEEEASTLYLITLNVGGYHPRRRHIQDLEDALCRLGISYGERNLKPAFEENGSLYFAHGDNRP